MEDGYGNPSLQEKPVYIKNIQDTTYNVYDIGYRSLQVLLELIDKSDIIFWNGSLGLIEDERYAKGSLLLVDILEKCTTKKIIIGGGETASLFNKSTKTTNTNSNKNIYISTGGGALLEYLQNKILYNTNLVGLQRL